MSRSRGELDNKIPGYEQCGLHPYEILDRLSALFGTLELPDRHKFQARGIGIFARMGIPHVYEVLNHLTDDYSAEDVNVNLLNSRMPESPGVFVWSDQSCYSLKATYCKRASREDVLVSVLEFENQVFKSIGFFIDTLSGKATVVNELPESVAKSSFLQKLIDEVIQFFSDTAYLGSDENTAYFSTTVEGKKRVIGIFNIKTNLIGGFFLDEPPKNLHKGAPVSAEFNFNLGLGSIG